MRLLPAPPTVRPPQPCAPTSALWRIPSALRCRSDCVRFYCGAQLLLVRFFLRGGPTQSSRPDRLVQRVCQYVRFFCHFRNTFSVIQQLLRTFQRFAFQLRCRTVPRLGFIKTLRPMLPIHFHVSLHRDYRHAERLDDFSRLHRPSHDHLTREHPEAPYIWLLVLKHRQVTVYITDLPVLGFYRDSIVDLGYSGWKDWQLQLWHALLLPAVRHRRNHFPAHSDFIDPRKNSGKVRRSDLLINPKTRFFAAASASSQALAAVAVPVIGRAGASSETRAFLESTG